MEQHPIPQNISSYQFRLVGDMTLKQFFELAGGVVVGLLFYSSPLLGIIKWPLAIISVILGVAMAFLPLEERPLERWIFAFFRAIYSPTLYYWKKMAAQPKFFQDEGVEAPTPFVYPGQKPKTGPLENLEAAEKGFLSTLTGLFSTNGGQTQSVSQPSTPTPQLTIPQAQPVKVVQETKPKIVVEEKSTQTPAAPTISTSQVKPLLAGEEMISTRQAMFSYEAAPPNPPATPNIIVGQAVDQDRKIIESAIIEIRDANGRPVRALRSNKLGHFITVTPLDNGRYDIATEKDGYEFSPVSFEATGQIIPPILVSGKNLNPEIL